jgi:hypothetical protein
MVVVAVIGVWAPRADRKRTSLLREVRNQVANNHSPVSLRDDLDEVKGDIATLNTGVARLEAQLTGLHENVRSQGHQLGEIRADLRTYQTNRR